MGRTGNIFSWSFCESREWRIREKRKKMSSSSSFSSFQGSKIKNKTKSKSIWSRSFVWARCKNLLSTRNQKMFISSLLSSPLLMAFHYFFSSQFASFDFTFARHGAPIKENLAVLLASLWERAAGNDRRRPRSGPRSKSRNHMIDQ